MSSNQGTGSLPSVGPLSPAATRSRELKLASAKRKLQKFQKGRQQSKLANVSSGHPSASTTPLILSLQGSNLSLDVPYSPSTSNVDVDSQIQSNVDVASRRQSVQDLGIDPPRPSITIDAQVPEQLSIVADQSMAEVLDVPSHVPGYTDFTPPSHSQSVYPLSPPPPRLSPAHSHDHITVSTQILEQRQHLTSDLHALAHLQTMLASEESRAAQLELRIENLEILNASLREELETRPPAPVDDDYTGSDQQKLIDTLTTLTEENRALKLQLQQVDSDSGSGDQTRRVFISIEPLQRIEELEAENELLSQRLKGEENDQTDMQQLLDTLRNLTDERTELREHVRELLSALEAAKSEVTTLHEQVSELEGDLAAALEATRIAQSESEEFRSRVSTLEGAVMDSERDGELAARAIQDRMDLRIKELEDALVSNDNNPELQARVLELEELVRKNDSQIVELQKALKESEQYGTFEKQNLLGLLESSQQKVTELEIALAAESTTLADVNLAKNAAELRNSQLEHELNTLQAKSTEQNLSRNVEELEEMLSNTRLALEERDEQLSRVKLSAEQTMRELQARIDDLENSREADDVAKIVELEHDLSVSRAALAEKEGVISSVSDLNRQRDELTETVRELRESTLELENSLADRDTEIERLLDLEQSLRADVDVERQSVEQARSAAELLEQRYSELVALVENQQNALIAECDDAKNRAAYGEQKVIELEEHIAKLEDLLDERDTLIADLESRPNVPNGIGDTAGLIEREQEQLKEQMQNYAADVGAALKQKSAEVAELQGLLGGAEQSIAALSEECNSLRDVLSTKEAEKDEIERAIEQERSAIGNRLRDLQNALDRESAVSEDIKNELDAAKKEREEIRRAVEEAKRVIQDREGVIAGLEAEKMMMEMNFKRLDENSGQKVTSLEAELLLLKDAYETLSADHEALATDHETLIAEHEADELERSRAFDDLKADLEAVRRDAVNMTEKLRIEAEERVREIEAAKAEVDLENEELLARMSELKNAVEDREVLAARIRELERATVERDELAERVKELEELVVTLDEIVREKSEELSAIQVERDSLLKSLNEIGTERERIEGTLASSDLTRANLEESILELERQKQQLSLELEEQRRSAFDAVGRLTEELQGMRSSLEREKQRWSEEERQKWEEQTAAILALENENKAFKLNLDVIKDDKQNLIARCEALEGGKKELQEIVAGLERNLETERTDTAQTRQRIRELQLLVEEKERTISILKGDNLVSDGRPSRRRGVEALELEVRAKAEVIKTLDARLLEYEDDIEKLSLALQDEGVRLAEMEEQLKMADNLRSRGVQLDERAERAESKLREAEQALAERAAQFVEANARLRQLEERVPRLEALKRQVDDLKTGSGPRDVTQLFGAYASSTADKSPDVQILRAELELKAIEVDQLRSEKAAELEGALSKVESYRHMSESVVATMELYREEMGKAQRRAEELEWKLVQMRRGNNKELEDDDGSGDEGLEDSILRAGSNLAAIDEVVKTLAEARPGSWIEKENASRSDDRAVRILQSLGDQVSSLVKATRSNMGISQQIYKEIMSARESSISRMSPTRAEDSMGSTGADVSGEADDDSEYPEVSEPLSGHSSSEARRRYNQGRRGALRRRLRKMIESQGSLIEEEGRLLETLETMSKWIEDRSHTVRAQRRPSSSFDKRQETADIEDRVEKVVEAVADYEEILLVLVESVEAMQHDYAGSSSRVNGSLSLTLSTLRSVQDKQRRIVSELDDMREELHDRASVSNRKHSVSARGRGSVSISGLGGSTSGAGSEFLNDHSSGYHLSSQEYAELSTRAAAAESYMLQFENVQAFVNEQVNEISALKACVQTLTELTSIIPPASSSGSTTRGSSAGNSTANEVLRRQAEEMRKLCFHELSVNAVLRNLLEKAQAETMRTEQGYQRQLQQAREEFDELVELFDSLDQEASILKQEAAENYERAREAERRFADRLNAQFLEHQEHTNSLEDMQLREMEALSKVVAQTEKERDRLRKKFEEMKAEINGLQRKLEERNSEHTSAIRKEEEKLREAQKTLELLKTQSAEEMSLSEAMWDSERARMQNEIEDLRRSEQSMREREIMAAEEGRASLIADLKRSRDQFSQKLAEMRSSYEKMLEEVRLGKRRAEERLTEMEGTWAEERETMLQRILEAEERRRIIEDEKREAEARLAKREKAVNDARRDLEARFERRERTLVEERRETEKRLAEKEEEVLYERRESERRFADSETAWKVEKRQLLDDVARMRDTLKSGMGRWGPPSAVATSAAAQTTQSQSTQSSEEASWVSERARLLDDLAKAGREISGLLVKNAEANNIIHGRKHSAEELELTLFLLRN
ncbi:hypothetical protein BJ742DRAFT_101600 [Cladochytrium replicatum]|nr:hypothetical protein BJ742DRAFT_101600 [Cladochytrium replicatum]